MPQLDLWLIQQISLGTVNSEDLLHAVHYLSRGLGDVGALVRLAEATLDRVEELARYRNSIVVLLGELTFRHTLPPSTVEKLFQALERKPSIDEQGNAVGSFLWILAYDDSVVKSERYWKLLCETLTARDAPQALVCRALRCAALAVDPEGKGRIMAVAWRDDELLNQRAMLEQGLRRAEESR
jgi:hypothetical protein